jgi:hypothetical protein
MGSDDNLSLTTVHPNRGGGGQDDLVANSTTLLYGDLWSGVTYVFFSDEDETTTERWSTLANVGGNDPSYYSDYE